jgi:hypothetical protein
MRSNTKIKEFLRNNGKHKLISKFYMKKHCRYVGVSGGTEYGNIKRDLRETECKYVNFTEILQNRIQ